MKTNNSKIMSLLTVLLLVVTFVLVGCHPDDILAPEAPTNLEAEALTDSTIELTWDAVEGAKTYAVYQGMIKLLTVAEPTHIVTGLQAGIEYCFTVTAINDGGESAKSAQACATTLVEEDVEKPSTPQNVNISDFSVSECLEKYRGLMYDDNDTIYAVAVNDSSLMIRTIAYFNCCSEEFWEELSMEGNKIRIEMFEDDKEPCDCYCPVSVEFVLSNLELGQTYKIILSRGVYGGYFSFEVVFEKDTDLMFLLPSII